MFINTDFLQNDEIKLLLEIAQLPEENDMRARGETEKCIYKFVL